MFCDRCGCMISLGVCNCNRPNPPTREEIPLFPGEELRRILYNCRKDYSVSVKIIASKWDFDEETTHKILWYLETRDRVAAGNYSPTNRVFTRTREPNYDFDAQVDAAVQFIHTNYDNFQHVSVNGVFYNMKSQGFEIGKKAIRLALEDLKSTGKRRWKL